MRKRTLHWNTDRCLRMCSGIHSKKRQQILSAADLLLNHQGLQYSKRVPPDKLRSSYLVQVNEEEKLLELYDEENLELTATLEPYQADGDEADYN